MGRLDEQARGISLISATPFIDSGEVYWESADRPVQRLERRLKEG